MATIRIVRVPAGDAPIELRRLWLGLELPLGEAASGTGHHAAGAYRVAAADALGVLAERQPLAAAWWWSQGPEMASCEIRFDLGCCVLTQD